jgi:hypothetical protein
MSATRRRFFGYVLGSTVFFGFAARGHCQESASPEKAPSAKPEPRKPFSLTIGGRFENPNKAAPRHIRINFQRGLNVPAHCSDGTVTVSVEWLTQHPEDIGLLTHELTHAVQAYPNYDPSWITEGLADYARFLYGPEKQPGWQLPTKLTKKQSYRDSYRVTGRFFQWLEAKHPGTLDKLHRRMQEGRLPEEEIRQVIGVNLDSLWDECVKELDGQ